MLRYYSLALISPLPALGAGVVCLSSATKPEGGYSKDTGPGLMQQHGKGGPNGPVWRKPLLPCSTRGLGWRLGLSAIGRPSLVWPQQELLSKARPPSSRVGWAHGHVRWWLVVPVPWHWLGLALGTSSSAVLARYSGARFLTFVPLSTGAILLHQEKGKGDLNTGDTVVCCYVTPEFSV